MKPLPLPPSIPITVQLTAHQRMTLMDIANEGSKQRIDDSPRITLLHLGLIVKRCKFTPAELKGRALDRKRKTLEVIKLLRQAKTKEASRAIQDIDNDQYHDTDSAWFLTPAAQQYLSHGAVTVKIGPTKPAKQEPAK